MAPRALFILAVLGAASMAEAQSPDVEFHLRKPPAIEFGDWLSVEFRTKLRVDFRDYSPDMPLDEGNGEFSGARVGIRGRAFHDLEYEVESELRDDEQPWRDVFVNFRRYRAAQIQAGRFKVPFGREQLISVFDTTFVERALISNDLTPGRDEGLMLHGRIAGRVLQYQTGVFHHDGDNASFHDNPGANASWAGRVVWAPWGGRRGRLRDLQAGVGTTIGDVPEGLNGLRATTTGDYVYFEPVYVRGRRVRAGVDGSWTFGPAQIMTEYIRVADQRLGQGIDDRDLPDVVSDGWYVSGSWVLTGEGKAGDVEPAHPFGRGGVGAFEVAARIETMSFGSDGTGGEPAFSNPRAANLLPNRDRVLTLGVNWYLNQFGRVTVNATREHLSDPERTPEPGRQTYWGAALRLQFVL